MTSQLCVIARESVVCLLNSIFSTVPPPLILESVTCLFIATHAQYATTLNSWMRWQFWISFLIWPQKSFAAVSSACINFHAELAKKCRRNLCVDHRLSDMMIPLFLTAIGHGCLGACLPSASAEAVKQDKTETAHPAASPERLVKVLLNAPCYPWHPAGCLVWWCCSPGPGETACLSLPRKKKNNPHTSAQSLDQNNI